MKIIRYILGQLQANCYLLINEDQCLIIDPADDASFIIEEVQRRRLKVIALLATHGHFDHLMAAGELQKSLNVPFYINKKDLFLVDRVEETAEHFLGFKQVILPIEDIKYFDEEKLLKLPGFDFKIIDTPGHTPGSVAFHFEKEKVVFTGDTLFKEGIGRYDFSYCDKKDLHDSLVTLSKLKDDVKIFSGHGEETSFKNERENLIYFLNFLK